jgi:hypothetical protein
LGLAAALIVGMRGLQYLWVRSRKSPSRAATRSVRDSSEQGD